MDAAAQLMMIVAMVLLLSAFGEFVFSRTGLPDVVLLVLFGVLVGPVLGVVSPQVLEPAVPFFSAIALTIILSGAASHLRLAEVAAVAPRALLLAIVGFVFSLVTVCAYLWLTTSLGITEPVSLPHWLTVGAIVGGSSSLILTPTLAAAKTDATVTNMLEVECSATDALCIVTTTVLIDFLIDGGMAISRPFVELARDIGVGIVLGIAGAAALLPTMPSLRDKSHSYTVFLAVILIIYALADLAHGNSEIAVVTMALLVGNAGTLIAKLFRGVRPEAFAIGQMSRAIQGEMTFLIKSFFFVLIGLLFPKSPKFIALGVVGALVLLACRLPAVRISTAKLGLTRKQQLLLTVAIPRGLSAGVLATLPLEFGLPGAENLIPGVFALIVTTVLLFAVTFALVARMPDEVAGREADSDSTRDAR